VKFSFVISAHPSTEERTSMLERCATSIKRFNPDAVIIAAGHCFPTRDLSHCVDFYIMEKKNEMLVPEDIFETCSHDSMFFWWYFKEADENKMFLTRAEVLSLSPVHHYAAFKNIYNGFKMAQQLGFEYSISCDADVEFHIADLKKFENDCENIMRNGEDGILFLAKSFGAYDSAIFFSKIHTLLSFSGTIRTKEDYKRMMGKDGYLVERFLVALRDSMIRKGRNSYLAVEIEGVDESSKGYFKNSIMNSPTQGSLQDVPILTVCTKNPVENFHSPDWVQRNFTFFLNDTSSRPRKYYIFFKQRGPELCERAELRFYGENREKIFHFENLAEKDHELRDLDVEDIRELFAIVDIKLECKFFYKNREETRNFVFNGSENLNKYFELNQILT
jgi:hypothetical protein